MLVSEMSVPVNHYTVQRQPKPARIMVRVYERGKNQISFSFWVPDAVSAEQEIQRLIAKGVDVDLVQDGRIIKSYKS
jgi:hypothetical protein